MHALRKAHPAAWLTALLGITFAVLFGALGVANQANYGTWSFDMGIYDQAIWLLSRGGSTFMSVRGLDVWGHHVNLIAYAFVPFYWLGAGPKFLYVAQACVLALGAAPVYLIARDRFRQPWMGLCFAAVYLLYAPVEWISWAMFHPEALVITPLLFAWWFGTHQRWGWFSAMVLLAMSCREDAALAVLLMGLVLLFVLRREPDRRRVLVWCLGTAGVALVWYVLATSVVIPHFNDGKPPFYVQMFYGRYGSTGSEVVWNLLRHPTAVMRAAVKSDRLNFYEQMSWPMGFTFLANPLGLLMAVPQLVASIVGASPYARQINYQYTSVMIAPMLIASIEGAFVVWRFKVAKWALPLWLIGCALVTNVQWSPSPLSSEYSVWATPSNRNTSFDRVVAMIPPDASVTATVYFVPHLSHRRHVYDWPNPFKVSVWGNDDCDRLPDPRTVQYVAIDLSQVGDDNEPLVESMVAPGAPFRILYEDDLALLLERTGTSPDIDSSPQAGSCQVLAVRHQVLSSERP